MKKILFNLMLLTAVSLTKTDTKEMTQPTTVQQAPAEAKQGLIVSSNAQNTVKKKKKSKPTADTSQQVVLGTLGEHSNHMPIPPFHQWLKQAPEPMKNLTISDLERIVAEKLEVEREEAILHVQMFFNILTKALELDKELLQNVAFPMVHKLGTQMFTNVPRYTPHIGIVEPAR